MDSPEVRFGSTSRVGDELDLLEMVRPVDSYPFAGNPEGKIFTDSASISDCVELVESFAVTAT